MASFAGDLGKLSAKDVVKVTFNVPSEFAKGIQGEADANMIDRGVWIRSLLWEWWLIWGKQGTPLGRLAETIKPPVKQSEEKS
ncbi:MAG: hypothetical protein AUJ07_08710 [Crenarchaeota archaeon 13_1_40CM_3_53_5]|nr:MAG: hypothetical protein AUJ07_08710 [Crenarchaeota archaeon 13_1_40CM_3_53_5]